MKEIEKKIIHAVFSENQFKEVSFLDPEDFQDSEFKTYWSLIKEKNGDVYGCVKASLDSGRKDMASKVIGYSEMLGVNNLQRMAVHIKESRFKRLFISLLGKLSQHTKNRLECDLLNEYIIAVPSQDIFLLGDSLLDYLGHQCSGYTKSRVLDYLKFIDDQVSKVKKVTEVKTN